MKLFVRVLILALCAFSAYTLPTLNNDNNDDNENARISDAIYQLVSAQMRASLVITPTPTPAEAACANQYNSTVLKINSLLINQTTLCSDNANKTTITNNQNVNVTVNLVRSNLRDVQSQIANCTAFNDTLLFINCTTSTFDYNLYHLDTANTLAYKANAEFYSSKAQVELVRQSCVDAAVTGAKTNLTVAANDYGQCLNKIKTQRGISAQMFNLLN